MIDIKLIREYPNVVKDNLKKRFQEEKIKDVEQILTLDRQIKNSKTQSDVLRADRNKISSEIGELVRSKDTAGVEVKKQIVENINNELIKIDYLEKKYSDEIMALLKSIPNILDSEVPLGKDDSENKELERFLAPRKFEFEIPYHTDILEAIDGLDLESARVVAGQGFYYLTGEIARLHSAILAYARDFMIEYGFTYVIPPYMIRSNVVDGVMSQDEKDSMMYKIEGEDLYLIGTSEHSMIGKYANSILPASMLPITLTSSSPCFRKEKGAHGIEERGLYRVHQFEKQEMIVLCEPDESKEWFEKLWSMTVELFTSMKVPVRTLECCSGDLANLKSRSIDVEAWSPRQKKFFEVGSCSNMTSAQSRRLGIRVKGLESNYYPHTLNNTVVAPPRMLIAFIENNLNEDLSINIPKPLQAYMGGQTIIERKVK